MNDPFIRSAIAAEIMRARHAGRDIDRRRLKRETGLTTRAGEQRFEALVSLISLELDSGSLGSGGAGRGQGRDCPDNGSGLGPWGRP
jgi:hypothetical protein